MVVLQNGNVGVGTSNPSAKLAINGFTESLGISVNNKQNTGVRRGIWLWSPSDSHHVIYSASPDGKSPANASAVRGYFDNGHRLRLRTATGQGFLFENHSEQALVDIDAQNGNLWTKGTAYCSGIIVEAARDIHLDKDGAFYRYRGEVYLTVDNHLYIRDKGGAAKFHFDTNGGVLKTDGGATLGDGGTRLQRVISGRVAGNGSRAAGSGFTSKRSAIGKYQITFSTAFATAPVMVVTCNDKDDDNTVSATTSTTGSHIATFDVNPDKNAPPEDASFSFIAIGVS